jgi:hypothetical protein
MSTGIVIRNLDVAIRQEDLEKWLLDTFGITPHSVELLQDLYGRKNTGEAIVECSSTEEAERAAASRETFQGRPMYIEVLKPLQILRKS